VIEPQLPGFARAKNWDVAWLHREKVRLAISLKSLLTNLGGTVPNRVDDLMGEPTNLQMYSPEVVIGYFMIFNVEEDGAITRHGCTWGDLLGQRLDALSGRRPPHWTPGTVEAAVLVRVDFSAGAQLLSPEHPVSAFFDTLVGQVFDRNPDVVKGHAGGDELLHRRVGVEGERCRSPKYSPGAAAGSCPRPGLCPTLARAGPAETYVSPLSHAADALRASALRGLGS
jgi:hypothetical protein